VGSRLTDIAAAMGPAGTVHMSLRDILRYLTAHRDRNAFLKPQTWTMLHTPPFGGNCAMGWVIRPDGALWHNGSNTLWYAEVLVDAAKGFVAAGVCNHGNLTRSTPAVSGALAEAIRIVPEHPT